MQAEAIRTQWDKRDAVVLRAGRYEALAVPSLGANVLKLTYRHPCGKTLDILRTPPCAQVLLTIAAYRLCAAAIEPLGAERIAPALQDFADILTTLFILMISIGAMFFVFVAALMRMGMGFA